MYDSSQYPVTEYHKIMQKVNDEHNSPNLLCLYPDGYITSDYGNE